MFAQSGLSIPGAITLFVVSVFWCIGDRVEATKVTVDNRNPRQQRTFAGGEWAVIVQSLYFCCLQSWGLILVKSWINVGIYVLMGLGLNIVVGFAGLLDLGYVAFYAIGAYTLGIFTTSEAVGIWHLTFWEATPIALLVASFCRSCFRFTSLPFAR